MRREKTFLSKSLYISQPSSNLPDKEIKSWCLNSSAASTPSVALTSLPRRIPSTAGQCCYGNKSQTFPMSRSRAAGNNRMGLGLGACKVGTTRKMSLRFWRSGVLRWANISLAHFSGRTRSYLVASDFLTKFIVIIISLQTDIRPYDKRSSYLPRDCRIP